MTGIAPAGRTPPKDGHRAQAVAGVPEGPWNPGLSSELPGRLLPQVTLLRPENASTAFAEAKELSDFAGLAAHQIAALRPGRLIDHEILIRVSADLAVYDGRTYEDLGINFRRMATTIRDGYIAPKLPELTRLYCQRKTAVRELITRELSSVLRAPASDVASPGQHLPLWRRLLGTSPSSRDADPPASHQSASVAAALETWARRHDITDDDVERSCLGAVGRTVAAVARKHGRLVGDRDLLAVIATNLAINDTGSRLLGDAIAPMFDEAVEGENYHRLPAQARPAVMNVKGASASGKSTMRPLQQRLAHRLGLPWEAFALISPDIWRKYLLDYAALGPDFKYAGMLSGHEVEVIDRKLDSYMADKAAAGNVTHLLIDRFRFDSFVPETDSTGPVRLLTRFGDVVYMFFMVTPPEATVERAWRRGQLVGRYKAVDDLLAHNIEAFAGMPELFFTWALRTGKTVHYEFLDNSVPYGSLPRTIAFGRNGEMNILDVTGILNIDRFRKVNVRARRPEHVYSGADLAPSANIDFLARCKNLLPIVNFADQLTGRVYARLERGDWVWHDPVALDVAMRNDETREALCAVGLPLQGAWARLGSSASGPLPTSRLDDTDAHTIGAWGPTAQSPVAGHFI